MKEEAICGNHGAVFSQPGFSDAPAWYSTTVPTTTQAALIRSGVYPDPYVSLNNMLIPDACSEHNVRYDLNKYSHLPNQENPWAKYLFMADLYTNTAYRAVYEAANKVRPRNSGTHIWKINAAWTNMVQQVFDWSLCCKESCR